MTLDEFIRNVDNMRIRYPSDAGDALEKGAKKMTRALRKATPVGKYDHPRKLNKSWRCKIKGYTAADIHAEIRSVAPHFHLVNRGFRRKNDRGDFVPNKGNDLAHVGFVKQAVDSNWDEVKNFMGKEFYKKVRDNLE